MVCEILAPQPGSEPALPALEGKVLTIWTPRKSRYPIFQVGILGLIEFSDWPKVAPANTVSLRQTSPVGN